MKSWSQFWMSVKGQMGCAWRLSCVQLRPLQFILICSWAMLIRIGHSLSCTAALLHCCTAALLRCCTVALLHCCTVALMDCCTVTLLHCCTAALLLCCVSICQLHFWLIGLNIFQQKMVKVRHLYRCLLDWNSWAVPIRSGQSSEHCCTAALLHCCVQARSIEESRDLGT